MLTEDLCICAMAIIFEYIAKGSSRVKHKCGAKAGHVQDR